MKQSHLLSLLQNDYTTVHVAFRQDMSTDTSEINDFTGQVVNKKTPRTFVYKAPHSYKLEVNDYVVVETPKGGPAVVIVTKVDETPNIDPDADFDYKWVVQRVDRTEYLARLEREQIFLETMKEVEREAQKAKLIEKFATHLPEGSEARRKYDEAIALAATPLQIGNKAE